MHYRHYSKRLLFTTVFYLATYPCSFYVYITLLHIYCPTLSQSQIRCTCKKIEYWLVNKTWRELLYLARSKYWKCPGTWNTILTHTWSTAVTDSVVYSFDLLDYSKRDSKEHLKQEFVCQETVNAFVQTEVGSLQTISTFVYFMKCRVKVRWLFCWCIWRLWL